MVKHSLPLMLAALLPSAVVDARPPPPPDDELELEETPAEVSSPAFNMLGLTMAAGALPIGGTDTRVMSVGLGLEHPVFTRTRVAVEYDWLWLTERDRAGTMTAATPSATPERHASGHRASLALRRELHARGRYRTRRFVDGELGGTLALASDSVDGTRVLPGGFVGLRLGYDLYAEREASPSRTFEAALFLRAIAIPDGAGLTLGLGMYWGN